eukprot:scaffold20734_cov118-Isochrysis_galbana.AAC.2
MCAVLHVVGRVHASTADRPLGQTASKRESADAKVASAAIAWPSMHAPRSPSAFVDPPIAITWPEQSEPGAPGSPGYVPSTFRTSRKLRPTQEIRNSTTPSKRTFARPDCLTTRRPCREPRASKCRRTGPDKESSASVKRGITCLVPMNETSGSFDLHTPEASNNSDSYLSGLPRTLTKGNEVGASLRAERASPSRPAFACGAPTCNPSNSGPVTTKHSNMGSRLLKCDAAISNVDAAVEIGSACPCRRPAASNRLCDLAAPPIVAGIGRTSSRKSSKLTINAFSLDTSDEPLLPKGPEVRHAVMYKCCRSKLLPLADDKTRHIKPDRWAIGAPGAPVNQTDDDVPLSRAVTGHIAPNAR